MIFGTKNVSGNIEVTHIGWNPTEYSMAFGINVDSSGISYKTKNQELSVIVTYLSESFMWTPVRNPSQQRGGGGAGIFHVWPRMLSVSEDLRRVWDILVPFNRLQDWNCLCSSHISQHFM